MVAGFLLLLTARAVGFFGKHGVLSHLAVTELQSGSALIAVIDGLAEGFAFVELFSGHDIESENFHGNLLKDRLS